MIKYQAKIFKDDDSYSVEFPDLPGCFSAGESLENAKEMAKEALTLYLEEARSPNWELPRPKNRSSKGYYWITPDISVAIPLMIRRARIEAGYSQPKLAKLMGISTQQLQKLEMPGKSNPTVKTLAKVSSVLGAQLEIELAS
jgi:antitoxin HicB